MRSLIKSHKRSSSSEIKPNPFVSPGTSSTARNSADQIELPGPSRGHGSKTVVSPLSTPNLQQLSHAQFTPPPPGGHSQTITASGGSVGYERGSSGSTSSMSSPKKLLTPIKKLFSSTSYKHHSAPASGDTLAQITSSGRKYSRNRKSANASSSSYVSLTKLADQSSNAPIVETKLHVGKPSSSLSTPIELRSEANLLSANNSDNDLVTMSSNAPSFIKGEENFKSINVKIDQADEPMTPKFPYHPQDETPRVNATGEKLASFHITESDSHINNDHQTDSSDESSDSSQFSFVKDMKGGRNTSIKYYKTGTPSQKLDRAFSNAANVFDQEQLANDMDGMSDYDYENNGDDEDYDDFEDTGRYNNLFGDDFEDKDDNYDDQVYADEDYESNKYDDYDVAHSPNPEFGRHEAILLVADDANDKGMYRNLEDGNDSSSSYSSIADNDNITTPTLIVIDSTYLNRINSISLMKALSTRPFNRSYHMSINGIDKLDSLDPVNVELAGPFHQELITSTDDILENYLEIDLKDRRASSPIFDGELGKTNLNHRNDISDTPLSDNANSTNDILLNTPDLTTLDCLGLFDISSPMVNGITVGANLRHRFPKNDSDENMQVNRSFINRGRGLPESKFEKLDFELGSLTSNSFPRSEKDVLRLRSVKSFHSSISDTMEMKIQEKVKRLESYLSTNGASLNSQNANAEVGLGLVYSPPSTSVEDIAAESSLDSELPHKLNDISLEESMVADEMRDLVATDIVNRREKRKSLRNSVLNMMDLLGNLEKRISNSDSDIPSSTQEETNINETSTSKKRQSIANMMNILADLEKNQSEIVEERDKELQEAKANRNSIIDMMTTLSKLESDTSNVSPADKKRDSINKMMATLAKLTVLSIDEPQPRPRRKSSEKRDSKALTSHLASLNRTMKPRYSWVKNDESDQFKYKEDLIFAPPMLDVSKAQRYSFGEPVNEGSNPVLYDDLLDEVNKLPEDFDFDEYELAIERSKSQRLKQPEFFRSNSYNKKPVKTLLAQNFASNKIETLNKTVTFYSKHLGSNIESSLNDGLSRGPSVRSVNSFASVNEEDEGEDLSDFETQSSYYSEFPKKNLTTITESPNIR